RGADGRAEGPVVARVGLGLLAGRPLRPLVDPAFQQGDLLRGERLALAGRGHAAEAALAEDAVEQQALAALPRHDHRPALTPLAHRLDGVQAQAGFLLEGAVAGTALFGQQGLDLTDVVVGYVGAHGRGSEERRGEDPEGKTDA